MYIINLIKVLIIKINIIEVKIVIIWYKYILYLEDINK